MSGNTSAPCWPCTESRILTLQPPRKNSRGPGKTPGGKRPTGTRDGRDDAKKSGPAKSGDAKSSAPKRSNEDQRQVSAWGVGPDRTPGAAAKKKRDDQQKSAASKSARANDARARTGEQRTERPARDATARFSPDRPHPDSKRPDPKRPDQKWPDRKPRQHRGPKGPTAPINPHPAHTQGKNGDKDGEGPQRIAKLLARAGIASRREIERMITEGRIAFNGALIDTPATLLSSLAGITVDGNMVAEPEETRLFLFHKPSGFLTAERDPLGRPTIYDKLPADLPRLIPIGRLDMTTEGLLLLTTDGSFKRQMELPSTGVERCYRARAFGEVSQAQLEELAMGVEVDGIRYGKIDANLERRTGRNQWIEMTLTEGKNREVRRVLEYLDLAVNRLIRTRYGPFELADLPPGAVVEVRQQELAYFRKSLDSAKAKKA
ncbi:MAG: pseudouridine synthase [Sphingobium sp.]